MNNHSDEVHVHNICTLMLLVVVVAAAAENRRSSHGCTHRSAALKGSGKVPEQIGQHDPYGLPYISKRKLLDAVQGDFCAVGARWLRSDLGDTSGGRMAWRWSRVTYVCCQLSVSKHCWGFPLVSRVGDSAE